MTDLISSPPYVPATFNTFFGATIAGTITTTPHTWTADGTGLFHTTTDLKAEWLNFYNTMMNGDPSTLTFIQRLEGNAEAVFENTGLSKLDATTQMRDREDVQRDLDAVAAAMNQLGLNPKAALTTSGYLAVERVIESNATLEELGMQGHGLNSPSVARYNGYTNDFQNNVDTSTLYVGGGLNNNQNALATFFDDNILSHLMFPTVAENGQLQQLNQNANAENTLSSAVGALDVSGTSRVYTTADFCATPGTASSTPAAPPLVVPPVPLPPGSMTTLFGDVISTTITVNGHTWVADSTGLFQTTTDLGAEWKTYYQMELNGQGNALNAIQRLEGNAEAVFENTYLSRLATTNPAQLRLDRQDVQRSLDAMAGVMLSSGIGLNTALTVQTYLSLGHALQNNAALEELANQGHGLNTPPATRYRGYTNDFQNNVDNSTLYVGGGLNTGDRAIAAFFDDNILSHLSFPVVAQNGELEQLNQNGAAENTVQAQVDALNASMFTRVYKSVDFNIPGTVPPGSGSGNEPPAGSVTTFFGASIAPSMTVNGHVWTVGTDGRFHTTTNLAAEWQGYYQQMLAGNGASLTAIQRLEGNAEAVFENTGLAKYTATQLQYYREDAQRDFDAIAATMSRLGLGGTLLTTQDYLNIANNLQSDAALEELAMQGHGLNDAPFSKYYGYTTDFQNNSDNATFYVGGGLDNGQHAIAAFFDDAILSHLMFPVISQYGQMTQLNQNGNNENTLVAATGALNDAMFRRVYVAGDFSKTASAVGPVVYVSPAAQIATAPALPVPGAGQMLSYDGAIVSTTLTVDGHTWVADAQGRYQTTSDLNLEWYNAYQTALAGGPLTLVQHWEANAEAVLENTALSQISDGMGQTDRSDVQRVIDAVVTIMGQLGLGNAPLTAQDYLNIEHALAKNAALQELAIQGEGLYVPYVYGQTKYNGYTSDFQYNFDPHTLYVGGGLDTGERAVADFMADCVIGHWSFPTIAQNGQIEQLNQNGFANNTLSATVAAVNATLFTRIYKAADFMIPGAMPKLPAPAAPATITGLYGDTIAGTLVANGHTWTVDASGLFHTTTNLDMEWRTNYQIMLAGHGDTLTATQRMEGNAEAVFEATAINTLWMGAAKEAAYREDVQRVIDAVAEAMKIDQSQYGYNANAPLSEASYVRLSETLRGNAALLELATQGAGVTYAPSARYNGAYKDIYAGSDWSTYYVGGGTDNGKLAAPYFFFDTVLSFLPSAVVWQNGHWEQLNQNGDAVLTAQQAAANLNETMFRRVLVASDFSTSATAVGAVKLVANAPASGAAAISGIVAPAGMMVTLDGSVIATTMVVNGHTWTATSAGTFVTTADLATEWKSYYAQMLAGNGGALNAIQRAEGNAEAVFEATSIKTASASMQALDRMAVQRELDAVAAAIQINATTLGIDPTAPLVQGSYLALERTLQTNAALEELAVQGHGLSSPPSGRYTGYINYFKNADSQTKYFGGGTDNGLNALSTFFGDAIAANTPFAVVWHNGKLVQLDQNGTPIALSLASEIALVDDTLFNRTYKSTDFHK